MKMKVRRKSDNFSLHKPGLWIHYIKILLLSGEKGEIKDIYPFQCISNPTLDIIPLLK